MGNISRFLQKKKEKRKKKLSFITQFKITFSLPFTDCKKVLWKLLKSACINLCLMTLCSSGELPNKFLYERD